MLWSGPCSALWELSYKNDTEDGLWGNFLLYLLGDVILSSVTIVSLVYLISRR